MTTYKVTIEQWVREVCYVEVEASSVNEAISLAYDADEYDWQDGDDANEMEAVEVWDPKTGDSFWKQS